MAEKSCPYSSRCGGCTLLSLPYEEELRRKEELVKKVLTRYHRVEPIIGMENPFHYRNKVEAVFGLGKNKRPVSGTYEAGSHRIVNVDACLNDNTVADRIILDIRGMLTSFRLQPYEEDRGCGLLRHVLVKRGFASGQVMVVLVTAASVFPSRSNFVKALLKLHPEITTIVQNINPRRTSVLLGDREEVLYGKGYIEDTLCGKVFRISPKSFYQINPVQTEKLYRCAIEAAGLTGSETVLDAYCGIGTIGIIAADRAKEVIGVERNAAAVRDAKKNAQRNGVENIRFLCADATEFLQHAAADGFALDVLLMDPPRSGSTPEFLAAAAALRPRRIVYISCCPETQARDLAPLTAAGYRVTLLQPVDLFPHTEHVENIAVLEWAGAAPTKKK